MLLVANFAKAKWCEKNWKMIETLTCRYSSESTTTELSNEHQHCRVKMVFKNVCVLVLSEQCLDSPLYTIFSENENIFLSILFIWDIFIVHDILYDQWNCSKVMGILCLYLLSCLSIGLLSALLLVANSVNKRMIIRIWEMTETLIHGYSSDSAHQKPSNEYQHGRVEVVFMNFCAFVLWSKVASAPKGFKWINPLAAGGSFGQYKMVKKSF